MIVEVEEDVFVIVSKYEQIISPELLPFPLWAFINCQKIAQEKGLTPIEFFRDEDVCSARTIAGVTAKGFEIW